ncbi:MAG: carbohydrate binding family 9 domain-containing protein [Ferruginibacter sp.]|nr:carbohydrate binding family 9 domain-containing protein [Ferruginibacter sp.]
MTHRLGVLLIILLTSSLAFTQIPKKELTAFRTSAAVIIDGNPNEEAWKNAAVADHFTELRPTPFKSEDTANATRIFIMYNNEGIYIGGNLHERTKDSIASELIGRDGFGNNDFVGIIFDTYYDKLNGFEYFVTPLGEQMDAKQAPNMNGDSEDFSWNAVWKSAAKIQTNGWSFEMFIPYSAIRFGPKKIQNWGLNIVRRRQKSGQQLFWQPIDPNTNGFLTQEGLLKDLVDIKPPLRLQFSPYMSAYLINDGTAVQKTKKTSTSINGGMDVKYGINQAFTLDMTLIPDFGQVQSDNRVLNLTPFEQRFTENRTFFTEGTELFNKGNLFYSRRIGGEPIHYWDAGNQLKPGESIASNPAQGKLINATKISGRTQKGLGIGVLNAITKPQYAIIENGAAEKRKFETAPLTNYNVLVLDQTMKHNSSVSFVNTNTMRSGKDYDANVSALLFDLNDKTNTWNIGGSAGMSALLNKKGKDVLGYTHSVYLGKTSGQFRFSVYQDLSNATYDKSDLGYFTNNNTMDQGAWLSYRWTKPKSWYNQLRVNLNGFYSRLVSPLDEVKGKEKMYQRAYGNMNANAQSKKLWWVGMNITVNANYNDFYEPRARGRVFSNKGGVGISAWWESNSAKKISYGGQVFIGQGGVFKRKSADMGIFGKVRFNSKFSVDFNINTENANNQPGWADMLYASNPSQKDTVIFSRRNVRSVENTLNIKYSFTNRMGLTMRTRHYWSKVKPVEFYLLDPSGDLVKPGFDYAQNRNQNYNYFTVDMVYTWQFAQGSFFNIVWKDIGEDFTRTFEKNYFKNAGNTLSGQQFNSLSLRVIYFLDYLTIKNRKRTNV